MSKSMYETQMARVNDARAKVKQASALLARQEEATRYKIAGTDFLSLTPNRVEFQGRETFCLTYDSAAQIGRWLIYWCGLRDDYPQCPRCGAVHTPEGPAPTGPDLLDPPDDSLWRQGRQLATVTKGGKLRLYAGPDLNPEDACAIATFIWAKLRTHNASVSVSVSPDKSELDQVRANWKGAQQGQVAEGEVVSTWAPPYSSPTKAAFELRGGNTVIAGRVTLDSREAESLAVWIMNRKALRVQK